MSDFRNFQQATAGTPPYFSYVAQNQPVISPMWVEQTVPAAIPQVNYISTGYLPNQAFFPQNMLHNPLAYASQVNLNNLQNTFPASSNPQNTLWSPSGVIFQSTSNLASPVSLANPLVTSPLIVSQNVLSPGEQITAHPIGITGQLAPILYNTSQNHIPVSLNQVNANYDHHKMLLQEQQEKQQEQAPHQHDQHLMHVSSPKSSQSSLDDNISRQMKEDSDQNTTEQEVNVSEYVYVNNEKPESANKASVQAAPPSTYLQNPNHPRQNTLPVSLPTSLNPSLQIKSKTNSGDHNPSALSQERTEKSRTLSDRDNNISHDASKAKVSIDQNLHNISTKDYSLSSSVPMSQPSPTSPLSKPMDVQFSEYRVIKPVYEKPKNKELCLRCQKRVYPMDKLGPIKEVLYHKICFTCAKCGTILHLKNFHHNPNDSRDLNVFCLSHKPKEKGPSCDASAVQIKSALAVPKLDKVNDQIRSDRYPSEVLAKSGYKQPEASALKPTHENFYYGMGMDENTTKSEPSSNQIHEQVQQLEPNPEAEQQQNLFQPHQQCYQEQQQHQMEQQYQLLFQHNISLQQQLLDNERALINIPDNDKLTPVPYSSVASVKSHNASVFSSDLQPTQEISQLMDNEKGDRKSSMSSASSMSSLMKNNGSVSEESLCDDLTSLKLHNQDVLRAQRKEFYSYDEVHVRDKQRQSFTLSSCSTSPTQVLNGSRSTNDSDSRRSSFSSGISSRDSIDFGASASSFSAHEHRSSTSSHERTDRPSSYDNNLTSDLSAGQFISESRHEHSQNSGNTESQFQDQSSIRFLPKNERMRMDRPSQFS